MKSKIIVGIMSITLLASVFTACGKSNVRLKEVENLDYADGILSYSEVANAEGYNVSFTHRGEVVYEDKIQDTAIDVTSLGLEGNITLKISAYTSKAQGPETEYDFTVYSLFNEVIIEAEDNLANFGTGKDQSNFRNNSLAHKGAYVGGIDDAGQGVYINYLCPVAGTFDFDAYYCMDEVGGFKTAHSDVWINGEYQTRLDYTKLTGWGGDRFDAEKTTCQITLKKGWNTISVMKNGDASDNWGGFAELDYFVIKGSGESYNVDDLLDYGERPAAYRLEAEMGSPRKKNLANNLYECKNPAIADNGSNNYSNGFILGGIESNYDGVEWHFNSPVKAKYRVKIAYASGEFAGSKNAAPSFMVTQEQVAMFRNADFDDMQKATFENLPYTGWNNVTVAEGYVEIVLEKGKNFIYCLKLDGVGSGFFQIDYADLTFVEEVE